MEIFKAIAKQEVATHESVAIRVDQKSYSYNQLISSAQKLSNLLCENDVEGNLGGARIGIVAKPSAEFVVGILATWFSGGVAVPLALSFPEVELLYVINNSDVSAILSTEDHSELMQSIANKTSSRFFHIPPVPNKSSEKSNNEHSQNGKLDADRIFLENIGKSIEDPALIIYTSGTTGKPKGVVHTHRSILAQVQALTKAWEFTSADRFLHLHVHGLVKGLLAPLYVGSTVEFLPKFSVSGIWKRWRESYPTEGHKAHDAITIFTGVSMISINIEQIYDTVHSHKITEV
ncbi:probable CoA ligase CCL8 [Vicia villosa]|uniref:probable CoA ligase CCL8 n=1 Tax=Vicia villosa TaxID=3911 RepID=UPI00273AE288|nr:probable CoA ligase CCL8 [Vicia villosa]